MYVCMIELVRILRATYLTKLGLAPGDAEVVLVDIVGSGQDVHSGLQLHHHIAKCVAVCMYVKHVNACMHIYECIYVGR